MATRGTALTRAIAYFRSAELDEARVAHTLVNEVMAERMSGHLQGKQLKLPIARRKQRTKVEITEAKAATASA